MNIESIFIVISILNLYYRFRIDITTCIEHQNVQNQASVTLYAKGKKVYRIQFFNVVYQYSHVIRAVQEKMMTRLLFFYSQILYDYQIAIKRNDKIA